MKPVKYYTIFRLLPLLCLVFASVSFGQTIEKNDTKAKPEDENKISPSAIAQKVSDADTKGERYRIGFQDVIEIVISRHAEYSGTYSINPNGTIFLPRLKQPIVAVCKTENQLRDEITAAYQKEIFNDPFITVRVVDQKSQAFGVIGAVEKPGYYYVNRKINLLELLTYAGGPNEKAGTQLIVARTGSTSNCQENTAKDDEAPQLQIMNFKIRDVQEVKQNLMMMPGDIVSILEADPFYVQGNVNQPGMFFLKGPTTLMQAIATAEGIKPATKKDKVRILRQKQGSADREELIFDLNDIESRKIQDPLLQPNDIVAVSQDKYKSILNSLGKAITNSIPTAATYRIP